jgi:hypothetical protein
VGESAKQIVALKMPEDAWRSAREHAGSDELICITGSFFIAAELRPHAIADAESVVRA